MSKLNKSYANFFKNVTFLLKIFVNREFRYSCIFIVIFTTILSLIPLANIELVKRLLNSIQTGFDNQMVIVIIGLIIITQLSQKIFSNINGYLNRTFELKLNNYANELIMNHISKMSFDDLFSASITNKLYFLRTNSTMKINSIFNSSISLFSLSVTFLSIFIYLFNQYPVYTTLVALTSVPVGIIQIYFNKKGFTLSQKINKYNREQFYLLFMSTTPQYLKEITQYSSMKYLVELHMKLFKKQFNPTNSLFKKETLANIFTSLIAVGGIGYVQYKTVFLALQGKILMGTLMSVLQSLGMIFQKINGLIVAFSGFHSDWLYVSILQEFLSTKSEKKEGKQTQHLSAPVCLSAEDLSYEINGVEIFKNINFQFKAGSVVGITGKNGVGKSTLLDIIQGLKQGTSGELYFNGISSTSFTDEERIKICQTLQQNPSRYELSLGENIGLSDTKKLKSNKSKIMKYIYDIDKSSFVFDKGFQIETRLGDWYEDSRQLSGGQWQRIAIYRLFYAEAPIYLIDEPTNNLDKNSLGLLKNMIKVIPENSLVIIVSHDLEFLAGFCTDIYTMTKTGVFEYKELMYN